MKEGRLDQIDKRILTEMQKDGRLAVVDLAERVGLSKSPCLQRLRKLEQGRYIRGYHADINPQKIEQGYLVYVQIKLESTKRQLLEGFNLAVKTVPQILSCHMMSGGYDYLLKVRTKDMPSFRALLGDVLADLPGVQQSVTFPVLEQVKETTMLSIK